MRTTRAGFTDEDFYGSNDTDVVHFRYLHKLLRQVPTMTLSDVSDGKFTQYVDHEATASKYGSNTYKTTVTTMDDAHAVSDHAFNPFIDDQLDKHYQDVVKPQIDRLDKLIADLTTVVEQQGKSITAMQNTVHDQGEAITTLQSTVHDQGEAITTLQAQYSEQTKQLSALEERLAALEQPK
ncbi:hypothetical protein [Ligilactobacillus sp.]|uniref:hypothetical protein n=1 Tax=Ligilactobacillus sp. TaxID=2767921 RepID=UPI002FE20F64